MDNRNAGTSKIETAGPGQRADLSSRRIGCFAGSESGPVVISIAGLHGNEPAGVFASRRVLDRLEHSRPAFRGQYLALAGNLPALREGCRYIDEDLNRIWFRDRINALASGARASATIEEGEMRGLLEQMRTAIENASDEVYFLDLHTTSAPGQAFSMFADTLRNRRLASRLPGPMVLGLDEHLDGTLLNFINDLGHVAVGFEAGQHTATEAVDRHEEVVWRTLELAGCLPAADPPAGEPPPASGRVLEVCYRHGVEPADGFVMEPGFRNLAPVRRGDRMARDRQGMVCSPEGGFVLMPLYQSQGDDGFFIVRRVRPVWLTVSTFLRRLGVDACLRFVPGIWPAAGPVDTYVVHPRIPPRLAVPVFHLLGFRQQRSTGPGRVFSRRPERPEPQKPDAWS